MPASAIVCIIVNKVTKNHMAAPAVFPESPSLTPTNTLVGKAHFFLTFRSEAREPYDHEHVSPLRGSVAVLIYFPSAYALG